eukprot:TRINITY_DN6693_c0_g1_i1.p3 TRINITY_DN6693_c0_g1~~TRINITY_DN6693_c0_g1_i1.p3  ORF type:complete len:211 (-),score=-24.08 TRINITY_DN6693_c0_g1_i1:2094-2726(-)
MCLYMYVYFKQKLFLQYGYQIPKQIKEIYSKYRCFANSNKFNLIQNIYLRKSVYSSEKGTISTSFQSILVIITIIINVVQNKQMQIQPNILQSHQNQYLCKIQQQQQLQNNIIFGTKCINIIIIFFATQFLLQLKQLNKITQQNAWTEGVVQITPPGYTQTGHTTYSVQNNIIYMQIFDYKYNLYAYTIVQQTHSPHLFNKLYFTKNSFT